MGTEVIAACSMNTLYIWLEVAFLISLLIGWILAITGIRNLSLQTFIVNTLLETNMGLPCLWVIHRAIRKRRNEDLSRVRAMAVQAAGN